MLQIFGEVIITCYSWKSVLDMRRGNCVSVFFVVGDGMVGWGLNKKLIKDISLIIKFRYTMQCNNCDQLIKLVINDKPC